MIPLNTEQEKQAGIMRPRRKSRKVKIGKLFIGGGAPISIQSMTTTETTDAQATIEQINGLEEVGCDIVRVSANTMDAAKALKEIKANIGIPLVADIHFDYRIALEAAKYADKLRMSATKGMPMLALISL